MKLSVLYNSKLAGYLEEHKEKNSSSYSFEYVGSYLNDASARPVSVNLPLQSETFLSDQLFPFFDNLLAEGWLLDIQLAKHKLNRDDRFSLVATCGLECVGAVTLQGVEYEQLP